MSRIDSGQNESVANTYTKHRAIRIDDGLWQPFMEEVRADGSDASATIRAWIREYLEGKGYEIEEAD